MSVVVVVVVVVVVTLVVVVNWWLPSKVPWSAGISTVLTFVAVSSTLLEVELTFWLTTFATCAHSAPLDSVL